jgi:hypothetical protein
MSLLLAPLLLLLLLLLLVPMHASQTAAAAAAALAHLHCLKQNSFLLSLWKAARPVTRMVAPRWLGSTGRSDTVSMPRSAPSVSGSCIATGCQAQQQQQQQCHRQDTRVTLHNSS